jgi:hypothetical protein
MCPDHLSQLRSHRCVSKAATHVSVTLKQFLPSKLKHRLGDAVNSSEIRVRGVACGPAGCGSHTLARGVLDRQSSHRGAPHAITLVQGDSVSRLDVQSTPAQSSPLASPGEHRCWTTRRDRCA